MLKILLLSCCHRSFFLLLAFDWSLGWLFSWLFLIASLDVVGLLLLDIRNDLVEILWLQRQHNLNNIEVVHNGQVVAEVCWLLLFLLLVLIFVLLLVFWSTLLVFILGFLRLKHSKSLFLGPVLVSSQLSL